MKIGQAEDPEDSEGRIPPEDSEERNHSEDGIQLIQEEIHNIPHQNNPQLPKALRLAMPKPQDTLMHPILARVPVAAAGGGRQDPDEDRRRASTLPLAQHRLLKPSFLLVA